MSEHVDWESLNDEDFERYRKRLELVELLLEEGVSPQERKRLREQYRSDHGISERTITNWIARYRAVGPAALAFHPRRGRRGERIADAELRAKLLELVHEMPLRSVAKLRRLVSNTQALAERIARISDRTIYRYLHEQGLGLAARQRMASDDGSGGRAYHHFEAPHSLALVQGDARDGIWLKMADGRVRKTYLFVWIDDFSRKLLFGQYYLNEKLPCLEDTFKKMILRWGIPLSVYMDNGSCYISHQFASVLAELKVRSRHHKAYASWAKGKIEALNKIIKHDFQNEAEHADMHTVEELNTAFWAWAEMDYNRRLHSATGQTPNDRFLAGLQRDQRRVANLAEFQAMFLWKLRRTVTKWGKISLYGNAYPVTCRPPLAVVEVRFNPFDLAQLEIHDPVTRIRLESSSVGKQVAFHAPSIPEETKKSVPEISRAAAEYFSRLRERYVQELKSGQDVSFRKLQSPPAEGGAS